MNSYHDLKKILCTEIDDTVNSIMQQGKMTMGDLEAIDKLTHSLKSLITTMAMEDSGYSYESGYSGIRRRDNMGRYADGYDNGYSYRKYYDNSYPMKRYSRDEGREHMIHQFEKMMEESSSPAEHEILQSAINKLRNM